MLAKRSLRPSGGGPAMGASNTESGIATKVSSKNDFKLYKKEGQEPSEKHK